MMVFAEIYREIKQRTTCFHVEETFVPLLPFIETVNMLHADCSLGRFCVEVACSLLVLQ